MRMESPLEETTFSFSHQTPSPVERRRDTRYMTILRVGSLIVDGQRELCLIRNISAGGLMAFVYSPLEEGRKVAVELKNNQPLTGTVSWTKDSNVGISFDEPIDVEEILSTPTVLKNGWRPRLPRVEVDRLATLRAGARTYAVSTLDISQGGIKVETDEAFPIGENVVLTLENFRPLKGVVRWCHGNICGITFHQVIPFHELMRWIQEK